MTKIIPFPIDENQKLTFDQCVSATKTREPSLGVIAGWNEEGEIFILNFGQISRKDAVWLAEQLKRHAFGEEII